MKAPLANHLIIKNLAVNDTPEYREKFMPKDPEKIEKLKEERMGLNKRLWLRGVVLEFRRRVEQGKLVFPITAKDIADRLWVLFLFILFIYFIECW